MGGSICSSLEDTSGDMNLKDCSGILVAAIEVWVTTIISPEDLNFKFLNYQIMYSWCHKHFVCDGLDVVKPEAASAVSWTSGCFGRTLVWHIVNRRWPNAICKHNILFKANHQGW